jgi:hypothetical protein
MNNLNKVYQANRRKRVEALKTNKRLRNIYLQRDHPQQQSVDNLSQILNTRYVDPVMFDLTSGKLNGKSSEALESIIHASAV